MPAPRLQFNTYSRTVEQLNVSDNTTPVSCVARSIPLCPQRAHNKLVNLATWVWVLQTAPRSAVPHAPRKPSWELPSTGIALQSPAVLLCPPSPLRLRDGEEEVGTKSLRMSPLGMAPSLGKTQASSQQCRPTLHRQEASGANDMGLLVGNPYVWLHLVFRSWCIHVKTLLPELG